MKTKWVVLAAVTAGMMAGVESRSVTIVSNNLTVSYDVQGANAGFWNNGMDTPGSLNMTIEGDISLVINPINTLLNVDNWWSFNSSAAGNTISLNPGVNNSDTWADVLGNPARTQDMTLEMWFAPAQSGEAASRQILYETGGGTGVSLTYDQGTLRWRLAGGGSPTIDVDLTNYNGNNLIGGDLIQAIATVDFANEEIKLYVNGELANTVGFSGQTSWDGGDGQGVGGRGGANLGGYGSGFSQAAPVSSSGEYLSFQGNIAITRYYRDRVFSDVDALQNYHAVNPVIAAANFAAATGTETLAWETEANWESGVLPTTDENVYILNNGGGPDIVTLGSAATVNSVMIGRGEDGTNSGRLEVNAGGDLTIERNLWIGAPYNTANSGQLAIYDGGSVTVGRDIIFGPMSNAGGQVEIYTGGTLTVSNIYERVVEVNSAQIFINGGTLNVLGKDIITQSFRVGDASNTASEFTLESHQRLENTGTFFIANASNATGEFTNDGGHVVFSNVRMATAGGAAALYVQESGQTEHIGSNFDLGQNAAGTIEINGGTFVSSAGNLRFGNNGGTGTLTINGGSFTKTGGADIIVGTGTGIINLNGGELDLGTTGATKNITTYNHADGATHWVTLHDNGNGLTPLNVTGTATFAADTANGGSIFDVRLNETADPASAVTWIGGDAEWDAIAALWETPEGINLTPDMAARAIAQDQEFVALTSANDFVNPGTIDIGVSGFEGWGLRVADDTRQVIVTRTGADIGFGAAHAFLTNETATVVTRTTSLNIQPSMDAGVSAAQMTLGGATTLSLPGAATDLVIGGSQQGQVDQNGGTVAIGGQLVFGAGAGSQGGIYNLNAGTLIVSNGVLEGASGGPFDDTVNNAQLQISGGTLVVEGGDVYVQRFALGQEAGSTGQYTVDGHMLYTSGDMVIGSSGTGTLALASGQISAWQLIAGEVAGATGRVSVTGGSFVGRGNIHVGRNGEGEMLVLGGTGHESQGNLVIANSIGGSGRMVIDLENDIDTWTAALKITVGNSGPASLDLLSGTLHAQNGMYVGQFAADPARMTIGRADQSTSPVLNVIGANIDLGRNGGEGEMTMQSGIYNQLSNNLVLGQANSKGTFTLHGGEINLAVDLRINNGAAAEGVFIQTGGTVNIARILDLGNNADAVFGKYAISGGQLMVASDLRVGDVGGTNTFLVQGGTAVVGGTLQIANTAGAQGVVILEGGTLNLSGSGVTFGTGEGEFNFTGGLLKNVGTFGGDLNQQGGELQVGNSTGYMIVEGDYSLAEAATLSLELAAMGGDGGIDFDYLDVYGFATLGGILNVTDISGGAIDFTTPFAWTVLTATEITLDPTFTLNAPAGVNYQLVDDDTALQLYVIPEPASLGTLGILALAALLRHRQRR